MNRAEHLQWCKDRSIEILNENGNSSEVFASFASDMSKHDETKDHSALELGMMMLIGGQLDDPKKMENFINGFN